MYVACTSLLVLPTNLGSCVRSTDAPVATCVQAERAQRDKQDTKLQMSHLKKDLEHSQAKKRSMDASFDKLDKARERTRTALLHSRRLHSGGGGGASSSPGLQDLEPFTMSAPSASSRHASLCGERVAGGRMSQNRSTVLGLASAVTEKGPRGGVLGAASSRLGWKPSVVDFSD